MEFKPQTAVSQHNQSSVSRMMSWVIIALIPGIIVQTYVYGWGTLIQIIVAVLAAVLLEAVVLKLRGRAMTPSLTDMSAILTACLVALASPPTVPFWLTIVAIIFAIVFAKHLFGGLGQNPFNPAMIGVAMVIIAYPVQISQWPDPQLTHLSLESFMQHMQVIFTSQPVNWDGITAATALDAFRNAEHLSTDRTPASALLGQGLSPTEWLSVAYLLGGLGLLWKKVIHWHIPVSLILATAVTATALHYLDPSNVGDMRLHLLSGATMMGAFFIATDPVSGSTTPTGKLIFGAWIGIFVVLIRSYGNYPDAVAFSVLIMNMAVPLIDQYTQPKVYGA